MTRAWFGSVISGCLADPDVWDAGGHGTTEAGGHLVLRSR